jgi:hypothetical protein
VRQITPEFRNPPERRCEPAQKEASVALSGNQSPQKRGIDWQAILRILLMQVLVLLALSAAFIGYVNWSSDRAWEEFLAADKAAMPDPRPQSQSSAPIQRVKDKLRCARRA